MFSKHVLKVFDRSIKLRYYIDNRLIEDITTVGEYMDNGLTSYDLLGEEYAPLLTIEDNAIIIRLYTHRS